jgi:hypothetical protein
VAVPTKEKVLIQYQDEKIKTFNEETEKGKFIKDYSNKQSPEIKILYPLNALTSYKGKELTYYKTDHHYTDFGSTIVAEELFKLINKDFPKIKPFNNFNYIEDKKPHGTWDSNPFDGSLYHRMNLTDQKIFDVNYKFFDLENAQITLNQNNEIYKKHYHNSKAINNTKIYLVGDSFVNSLGMCLAYSFKDTIVRRANMNDHLLYAKDILPDIEKEQPTIVIFVYASPHFIGLRNFFKE